jgi:type I restriction-modification system DNA methylase subunit
LKKEETNDIIQYLLPILEELGIDKDYCKIDVTTEKSGNKRGDIWISSDKHNSKGFEGGIYALIEAKHRNSIIGDIDWRDAMRQGKEKGLKQGLNFYIVSNCISDTRYYNAYNDDEIILDGKNITKILAKEVLQKIQTQVNKDNSYVLHKASKEILPIHESQFRSTLKNLANTYRSAGLKKGDERIDPTVSFVVLKYISEKEEESRTLDNVIKLWEDFKPIVNEDINGDLSFEFKTTKDQIWGNSSPYKENDYADFRDLISFSSKLKHRHFLSIYKELDNFHFHGANFDVFGAIYEEFASQTKKKEFGEFYTRRHITEIIAKLLFRNELVPRDLKVCDPACGTGGFLTEAYKALLNNYSSLGKYNDDVKQQLKFNTFYGFDNDDKSVARTKLNMFLVGDGHTNIYENDSIVSWKPIKNWNKNSFDYIITNPPMGKYDGEASIENFQFTNERRNELLFMERNINALNEGGEMAIVLNDGSLEAPTRSSFRRKILENCNILAIISLSKFAFAPYTKEKTYVLFLQKKHKEQIGEIQEIPIWHYILDYDGYANSDKRYKTKYHDDIPELEELFENAIKHAQLYKSDKQKFDSHSSKYTRDVNERERSEGLWGLKYGYSKMENINETNFYNLITEYHLRPYIVKQISLEEFENKFKEIIEN